MIKYQSSSIAILVPTKDRPEKIRNLLESLVYQTVHVGQIIIVDGGKSIEPLVLSYLGSLPIEYYSCYPPGQIRQRNLGISKLKDDILLVATLDDDLVLFNDSIEKMLLFWNEGCPDETAGVSFNIVNCLPEKHNFLKGLMGLSGPNPGKVLKSGRNTPILNIKSDIQSEWLCGGATVWKKNILMENSFSEKNSKWASSEDLIFSYPIGKKFPLYVCSKAKVNHEHVYDHNIKHKFRYYGKTETLWLFYFVESNKNLSRLLFYWSQASLIIGRIFMGCITFNKRHFDFALGHMRAVIITLNSIIMKIPSELILNEEIVKK